jgi:hypothetical protein
MIPFALPVQGRRGYIRAEGSDFANEVLAIAEQFLQPLLSQDLLAGRLVDEATGGVGLLAEHAVEDGPNDAVAAQGA